MSGGGITTTDTNKTALAVMTVLLLTMALGVFSNALYAPEKAAKPGFNLPEGGGKEVQAAAPKEPPLPTLLAKADVKKGQADVRVCESCHNLEKGAGPKVGPPLYGVVGRPKGSIPGFGYSDGMKSKGGKWTYADLNTFLTKPSAFVSGTKMTYPGEPDPQKRADIIDYLHTLSDSPLPLPKEAAAAPAAPAEKGGPASTGKVATPATPAPATKVAPAAPVKK